MTFRAGTKLTTYEIVEPIGRGGMGEVYRAFDSNLRREVAIKVLPENLDMASDRVSRFQREARILASLNHPNIAAIHDFQKEGSAWFLVLEFVEGETLAQRIARGPMPLQETLEIGRQIAGALETAHEKGIVHRDLKPANIKITPQGRVKVLDFGLAKVCETEPSQTLASEVPTTIAANLATETGIILGTPAYMSPEQVRGRESDKRADIWAFGAVLFEMLTGRASFSGETLSDTITSVLSHEIPWNSLPPIVPSELRNLLRRCLERDSNRRLRDIGDARIVIDELLEGRSAPKVQPRATTKPSRLLHAMAALGWILAGVLLALLWPQPEAPAPWTGTRVGGSDIALTPRVAPDQKRIAFLALVKGVSQVGVLDPKSGNFTVLTTSRTNGYTGAISWSVDGTRIYYTRMQGIPRGIYSVPALGGDERLVLENAKGGEALPDGSLIVSRIINRRAQIHRFWPVNGRLEPLPAFIPVEGDSFPVRLLPDGSGAVFLGRTGNDTGERSRLHLLSFSTGRAEAIPIDDSLPETSIPVETLPFAITPKGESVLILVPSGDRLRILEISIDGRHKPQPILDLQAGVWGFDVGADGSIYVDQVRRPIDILRFTTAGKELQRVAVVPNLTMLGLSLYLADGRTLVPAVSGGRRRLLTVSPGEDATPFIDTDEQTSPPVVHAGKDRVAFLIGSRSGSRIAIATVQDGRIIRQIDVPLDPAARPTMAFSPDGKTLYFSRSGSIWRLLLDQGQPEKLHPGDGVATMPDGKNLIISFNEEPIRWAIYSLEKGTEQPIRAGPDFRLTPVPPAPGSASPDGRILLPIAVPDSWFYSPGLFDPRTGAVQRIPLPYVGDFFDLGWTPDGKVVAAGYPFESTIWRFERVAAAP